MDATVTAIGVDIVAVSLWSVGVSMVGTRLPHDRFSADGVLTRLRPWELDGRVYERMGVKRWKDRLPDAGVLLGGSPKARLPSRDPSRLVTFAAETRRAELVHWAAAAIVVVLPLWNPAPIAASATLLWIGVNLPCVIVQRYNRARLARVLERPTSRRQGVVGGGTS